MKLKKYRVNIKGIQGVLTYEGLVHFVVVQYRNNNYEDYSFSDG